MAINAGGVIVGQGYDYSSGVASLLRWPGPGVASTPMQSLAGFFEAQLTDTNDAGASTGIALGESTRGARWSSVLHRHVAPKPSGFSHAEAYAINETGTVLGRAFDALDDCAVRWAPNNVVTVLGHLGLSSSGTVSVGPSAINSAGTAVGGVQRYDQNGEYAGWSAVRWDATGTAAIELEDFGPFPNPTDIILAQSSRSTMLAPSRDSP